MKEPIPLTIQPCPERSPGPDSGTNRLRQALSQATTWEELGAVCRRLDALHAVGALERAEVEALTGTAILLADLLPDSRRPEPELEARVLLPARPHTCHCCGAAGRWHNHGVAVCAVCHPHPGRHLTRARSAA